MCFPERSQVEKANDDCSLCLLLGEFSVMSFSKDVKCNGPAQFISNKRVYLPAISGLLHALTVVPGDKALPRHPR